MTDKFMCQGEGVEMLLALSAPRSPNRDALARWCRDVLRKYSREDIGLFLIRLRKVGN